MEDVPTSTSITEPSEGCGRRILRLWHKITIEPAVFLFTFAYGFFSIIAQNLLIERICQVNLNLTSEVCEHLDQHKYDQMEVQKQVTLLVLYTNILSTIPCIFLTLLVGPWSDRNGRKPLMIAPILGCILSQVVLVLMRAFPEARGE
ncbi:proton-coupled folate transporter-like [Tigriopus californicus]|uniref:proton-coupled folate transporter-like n=1 Tax=Tigriopus californicus TaxID=6832 RepID=UPI0027DA0002|nr:proton-coupled folate transporter-like [Tigriopus californicus]